MKKLLSIIILFTAYSAVGQTYTINTQVKHNDTFFLKTITYTYHVDSVLKYVATQHWQDTVGVPPIIYDTAWYYQRYRVIDSEVSDSTQINKPTLSSLGITEVGRNLAALTNPNAFSLIRINSDNNVVTRTLSEAKQDLVINNVDNTSDANKPVSSAQQTALNLKANLASPTFTGTVGGITASMVGLGNVTNESKATMFISPTFTGTPVIPGYTKKVAQADIASTASATGTTTLFTPAADGFYRVAVYLKITTTGTSPVAGPVTITYTSADGSVAQSHVLLMQSVTGTVVTTTVNNSTTTGTVNGSMVIYAKSGVAITFAIAVSGTFGAGRYMAHIFCEQL